eukprot:Skav235844  [mRNA]  locus=scaffold1931:369205:369501:+ [translate_table: standard]
MLCGITSLARASKTLQTSSVLAKGSTILCSIARAVRAFKISSLSDSCWQLDDAKVKVSICRESRDRTRPHRRMGKTSARQNTKNKAPPTSQTTAPSSG